MATFPSYARVRMTPFSEKRETALLRSEMESGPPKQAKIKSRVLVERTLSITLTSRADYDAFITWFSVTINEGADWFSWTDPLTRVVKDARFVGGGLDATPVEGNSEVWTIPTKIETWG